jgi:hypothetical protein
VTQRYQTWSTGKAESKQAKAHAKEKHTTHDPTVLFGVLVNNVQ